MGVDGYPVDALEKLKFMWDGYQYSGKALKKMADELVLRGYLVTTQHPQDPSAVVYSVNNIMDVSSDFEKEDPASFAALKEHKRKSTEPEVIHSAATDYVNAQPGWIRENRYPAGSLHMQQRTLDEAKENLKAKVRSMLSEVIDTLNSKFFVNDPVTNKPAPCINDVKRALIFRLVNPLYARELDVAVPRYFRAEVEWLNNEGKHEWFSDGDITSMEAEYPAFVQEAKILDVRDNDVNPVPSMDRIEDFWHFKRIKFPALSKLVKFAYTCTASSASVERLFSLLKRSFSLQQMKFALEDYVEGSVMLQFNRKFIRAFPHLA